MSSQAAELAGGPVAAELLRTTPRPGDRALPRLVLQSPPDLRRDQQQPVSEEVELRVRAGRWDDLRVRLLGANHRVVPELRCRLTLSPARQQVRRRLNVGAGVRDGQLARLDLQVADRAVVLLEIEVTGDLPVDALERELELPLDADRNDRGGDDVL